MAQRVCERPCAMQILLVRRTILSLFSLLAVGACAASSQDLPAVSSATSASSGTGESTSATSSGSGMGGHPGAGGVGMGGKPDMSGGGGLGGTGGVLEMSSTSGHGGMGGTGGQGSTCIWIDITTKNCSSGIKIADFCPAGRHVAQLERCDATFYTPDAAYQMYMLSGCPDVCPIVPDHVAWRRIECCL